MVDPTWRKPCPACGYAAHTNQMGQTYSHSGVNGCPYSGTGPLQRQHIYPLKFDYRPCMTAAMAYADDGLAGTVRYDQEDLPAAGEFISLRTGENEVFGIAKVAVDVRCTVAEAAKTMYHERCRYRLTNPDDLLAALNGYYDDEIEMDDEVTALVYKPWIAEAYYDGPPVEDGV